MFKRGIVSVLGVMVAVMFLLSPPVDASKNDWNFIKKVENAAKKTVLVKGKERTYYELNTEYGASITVEGPKEILVRTRFVIPADARGDTTYALFYKDEKGTEKVFKERTRRSISAKLPDKNGPAVGSSMIYDFDVPAGTHTYWFKTKDGTVLARFYDREKLKKINWEPLVVPTGSQQVYLVEKSKVYRYHAVEIDEPFTFDVTGPTQIQLMTRLDFSSTMVGEQRFSLMVQLNDGDAEQYSFSTRKSKKYIYANKESVVPGLARKKIIDVPDGTHTISATVTGTQAAGASIRVLEEVEK